MPRLLELGKKALAQLEDWAGKPGAFYREKMDPAEVYHLVVFSQDADYLAFVDDIRQKGVMRAPEEGDDLAKKVLGFAVPRCLFTTDTQVRKSIENWMVYSTSSVAVDAFYASYGKRSAPAWLREGVNAELQRQLCSGQVLWHTIAYEVNEAQLSGNWAKDVINLIKKNDPMLKKASEVMDLDLIRMPSAHYKQMWSLCQLVRKGADGKKAAENKFFKILETTAEGTSSQDAVKTLFKASDPELTQVWHQWAFQQK
jgi:hypothetical protein